MKMKLFLFTSLLVASAGLSMLLTNNAYAIGESYKWIDKTTIEGSAGAYSQNTGVVSGPTSRPVAVGTVRFTRVGNTAQFKAPTDIYTGSLGSMGSTICGLQLSITLTSVDKGTLATNDPGKTECTNTGLASAVTVADSGKGASATELNVAGPTNAPPPEGTSGTESTCKVDGVGWIVCPVVKLMGALVDGAYGFVASLLTIQPIVSNGSEESKAIYDAWSIMRNFANIAFVIAFMIIIFSQLTSVGLNNYGIKKMLPRLIVAAILVNVSFWICAIAVDISNILGVSINSLFTHGIPTAANVTKFTGNDGQTGNGFAGIAGLVLVGAGMTIGVLYATLSALIPALLAALIAIATVFIVLTIRQALVILLIIISPLAFVAYLLPNTESLFKKWMGLFKTLLLMFPIIALIFGASALASKIVMGTASGPYAVAVQIMGALIAIIPLALTPIVMKTAGGFLNRIGGFVNNPNKGPVDALRKKATGFRDYRQDIARGNRLERGGKLLEGGGSTFALGEKYSKRRRLASMATSFGATRSVDVDKQKGFAKAVADESAQAYFAKRALGEEGFARSITGDDKKVEGLKASAQSAVDKITQQDAVNREILYTADTTIRNNPKKKLEELLASGDHDEVGIKALGSMLMKGGASGYGQFNDAVAAYENSINPADVKAKATIDEVKKFVSDNGRDFKAKDPAMLKWAKDVEGFETLQKAAANPGAVTGSDQEVASVAPDSLRKAVQYGNISVEKAHAILSNPDLAGATSDDNKQTLRAAIAHGAQPINAPDMKALKLEIQRLADTAPTVEQIQHASAQATVVNPELPAQVQPINIQTTSTPDTLNITHAQPPAANQTNYRTTPPVNTGSFGNNPASNGLYTPSSSQQPPTSPPNTPPNP